MVECYVFDRNYSDKRKVTAKENQTKQSQLLWHKFSTLLKLSLLTGHGRDFRINV